MSPTGTAGTREEIVLFVRCQGTRNIGRRQPQSEVREIDDKTMKIDVKTSFFRG
jgi:hypothetical protein